MRTTIVVGCMLILVAMCATASAGDGNRLTHLDQPCDPYYVHRTFPRLVTAQWVGEEGVDAVVTLGIDDMRDPAAYEAYLRPILNRLKKIDGRAPVSIMTNSVDHQHEQLSAWLREGLSIECHTADHPCPCLQGGDFDAARSTYDRCVDQMAAIPGNRPVAFRFPCMDSMNTPSPRAFAEIMNAVTEKGNYLQVSTSVSGILTSDDPDLPRRLTIDGDGRQRFEKYIPFRSYVNKVENYPYPFVIGGRIWEFPTTIPDDWQGQHLHRPHNPQTVEDYKAAIDATVLKQGVANLVFHPHAWIRNTQMAEIVDHVDTKHGKQVKLLNFRECLDRVNKHLLAGQPLRAENGQDNGVRLLDLNNDGYLDVVIGNEHIQRTRVWLPEKKRWRNSDFPVRLVHVDEKGNRHPAGVRFFISRPDGQASLLVRNERDAGVWHFSDGRWLPDKDMLNGLTIDDEPIFTAKENRDLGVRMRDLDGDGVCELIAGSAKQNAVLRWNTEAKSWRPLPFSLPENTAIVGETRTDAGLRFVDVDGDGHDDVIFSDERRFSLHLFSSMKEGWSREVRSGTRPADDAIPMIVRSGTNNGAWFARRHMWVQNEDTNRLPDGVDRRSFVDLLGDAPPGPLSPEASRKAIEVRSGFRVELVAAEPLVMDPVHFDIGPDGKLWVVEMADYPLGLDDKGQPGGRVRFLEDTDGDGSYDKSTLFLDGLSFPSGVLAWRSGVLVSAAPEIFYAEDTDGDGRADKKEVLYRGFGEGNQQHRVNGFWRGLDNWVYVANGDSGGTIRSEKTGDKVPIGGRDLRIRPDSGQLDPVTGQSQYGRTCDNWGNWFGCNNSFPLFHFVLADHYLRRNAHSAPPAVRRDICTVDNTLIYPVGRVISHWSGYTPPPAGEGSRFTSANSATIYRDALYGEAFEGNLFASEPVHNLIHRHVLSPQGVTFSGTRAEGEEHTEFLASHDPWFRPCGMRIGPDGALWVADIYRLVIEHPEWIDDEVEKRLDLRAGRDRGRIYRIVPVDQKARPIPRLDKLPTRGLVASLDSSSSWQRDMVQQLLVWRGDKKAIEPLQTLAAEAESPLARLHALCTLDGLDAPSLVVLLKGLSDDHPGVRRHAIRLCESQLDKDERLGTALVKLLDDKDPHVQLQLACTLGQWRDPQAGRTLGILIARHRDDPFLSAAAISSLHRDNVADALAAALAEGNPSHPLIEQLFQLAGALGDEKTRNQVVQSITHTDDGQYQPWQLSALASMLQRWRAEEKERSPELAKRVAPLLEQARKTLAAEDALVESLAAAIELLGHSRQADDAGLLAELLVPQRPPEIQTAAAEALAQLADEDAPELLLKDWKRHGPALRQQILGSLLSHPIWVSQLLNKIESGRIPAGEIDIAHRQQLLEHSNDQIRQQAQRVFQHSIDANRAKIIAQYQEQLRDEALAQADAAQGAALFKKHCSNCHQVKGVGSAVGPDLAALTNRSTAALLEAILDPNRAVEDKYRSYTVITDNGQQFAGILTAETGTSITLRQQEGKQQTVLRKDIEQLVGSGKSLMPEGFEQEISPQHMAHLMAFLNRLGPPPKQFPGNQPRVVTAGEDGTIVLPATAAEIYGSSLVFEQRFKNLGYWCSQDDRAEWTFEVPAAGEYDVVIDFACHESTAGNRFVMETAQQQLSGEVPSTGTWENYAEKSIGRFKLNPGPHRLTIRSNALPTNALIDLRTIHLKPPRRP